MSLFAVHLSRSHDPVSIEPYLGRCFPGIKRLVVTKDWGVRIHAIISPEGEQLMLRAPVDLVVRVFVSVSVYI